MMSGFVQKQGAAAFAQAVPAPEIGGAVVCIQIPVKVHGGYLAQRLGGQQFFDFRKVAAVAVVESYVNLSAALFFGTKDAPAFVLVDGHRLFRDDLRAHLEPLDNELMVCAVHGGYNDGVGPGLVHHLFKIGKCRAVRTDVLLGIGDAAWVDVAQADKFEHIAVFFDEGFAPEGNASHACADQGDSPFAGGGYCGDTQ